MKNYKDQFGVEIQLNYPTKKKLVKSGCLVEVYQFGNDILLGRKRHKVRTPEEEALRHITPPNHEEVLKSSTRRAKRMIKRLIYSNSFKWLKANDKPYLPITLTLTFEENIQDLKQANYEFTKFIRRLNYETNGIEGKENELLRAKARSI